MHADIRTSKTETTLTTVFRKVIYRRCNKQHEALHGPCFKSVSKHFSNHGFKSGNCLSALGTKENRFLCCMLVFCEKVSNKGWRGNTKVGGSWFLLFSSLRHDGIVTSNQPSGQSETMQYVDTCYSLIKNKKMQAMPTNFWAKFPARNYRKVTHFLPSQQCIKYSYKRPAEHLKSIKK